MALLVCETCGVRLLHPAQPHACLDRDSVAEARWHPSHEQAAAMGDEYYCSAMHVDDWATTGQSRSRP